MTRAKLDSQKQKLEVRPPNRIRNNEIVRDATVHMLSHSGLEGTNFNSVSIQAGLSNSVLRKRFADVDALLVDTWRYRSIEGFIQPLNMTIMSYLLSEHRQDHQNSKKLLNSLFDLTEVHCASLEILAVTASHDSVCEAVSADVKSLFNQPAIKSNILKAQYIFYVQYIIGTLAHYRGQLIDRDHLVERLHQLLVNAIVPTNQVLIPEVDASFIRGSFVTAEQSAHHELMNACLTCVARHGFANTTTKMIAKEALVSEGKLFAYFPSKLELFLQAISNQIENGFIVNFREISKWNQQYGAGIGAAILIREYLRPGLDLERALQIEYLRLSWLRPEMFDKRNKWFHKSLVDIGVAKIDEISMEQDVDLLLSVSASTGATILARLDREAYKLPYATVTQKIFGLPGQ